MLLHQGNYWDSWYSNGGIKANLDKIRAIMKIKSPKMMKEEQSLKGKVTAFNKFVSQAIDKCLPFFKVLKKAFQWTNECEESLTKLKDYLTQLPLLSPSVIGEKLHLYLAISNMAVSSTLIKEEEDVQRPVYYTSQAFQEAEVNNPRLEKIAFALVTTSRKLCHYFQVHPIVIMTNQLIRKTMNKIDAARRLVQWAIELG